MSMVTLMLECPSRSRTTFGCAPATRRAVVCACLRPLMVVGGISSSVTNLRKVSDQLGPDEVPDLVIDSRFGRCCGLGVPSR